MCYTLAYSLHWIDITSTGRRVPHASCRSDLRPTWNKVFYSRIQLTVSSGIRNNDLTIVSAPYLPLHNWHSVHVRISKLVDKNPLLYLITFLDVPEVKSSFKFFHPSGIDKINHSQVLDQINNFFLQNLSRIAVKNMYYYVYNGVISSLVPFRFHKRSFAFLSLIDQYYNDL